VGIYLDSLVSEYKIKKNYAQVLSKMMQNLLDKYNHKRAEVGVIVVDDKYMRELNRDYRGLDEPTDVLAFVYLDDEFPETDIARPYSLGEIYLSYYLAGKQAREKGHSTQYEIFYLVVHGLLHLLGYDHEDAVSKEKMDSKHNEIMNLYSTELLGE